MREKSVTGSKSNSRTIAWIKSQKRDILEVICICLVMGLLCVTNTYAISTKIGNDDKLGLQNVVNLVIGIVKAIGIIVAIVGAGMVGLGLTQDNADSLNRGIKVFAGGVIAAGATFLISWVGLS